MQARQKRTAKVGARGREAHKILSVHVCSEESQRGEGENRDCIIQTLQDKEQDIAVRTNQQNNSQQCLFNGLEFA